MIERTTLAKLFSLNPPSDAHAIRAAEAALGLRLPPDYRDFLLVSNGLATDRLVLLEAEHIAQRNTDYEVQDYLPGFVMIGDDGGGTAVLMRDDDPAILEVGMGSMDLETMRISATRLHELLVTFGGRVLSERR